MEDHNYVIKLNTSSYNYISINNICTEISKYEDNIKSTKHTFSSNASSTFPARHAC